jgi:hypothetical protein
VHAVWYRLYATTETGSAQKQVSKQGRSAVSSGHVLKFEICSCARRIKATFKQTWLCSSLFRIEKDLMTFSILFLFISNLGPKNGQLAG